MHIETLESRRLLSADLSGGVLTITGTGDADHVVVKGSGGQINVSFNGVASVFARGAVERINVFGAAGDDHVMIKNLDTPAMLSGGDGRDTLAGAGGEDTVIGGLAVDFLYGNGGDDIIEGGTGIDRIMGGDGDDYTATAPDYVDSIELRSFNRSERIDHFPQTSAPIVFGVIQNSDGTTTLQMHITAGSTARDQVFSTGRRTDGIDIEMVATQFSGGGYAVITKRLYAMNLGRLPKGPHLVRVTNWDGTLHSFTLTRTMRQPAPPGKHGEFQL